MAFSSLIRTFAVEISKNMKYDQSKIPPMWRYCFNESCPKKDHCLRFQSALEMPQDNMWGQAIYPNALQNGRCAFYRPDEKVRLATGFVVEDNPLMSGVFVKMRPVLTGYLGGNGTYYLYRNGKKWLSPKKQRDIEALLRKHGFNGDVVFGQYLDDYDFT